MIHQNKFTRKNIEQQKLVMMNLKRQKTMQNKLEDMELAQRVDYNTDIDPALKPNVQYSNNPMGFANNNSNIVMQSNPVMQQQYVPNNAIPVNIDMNQLLSNILDLVDSYTGTDNNVYNKIINALNTLQAVIKSMLDANRNSYMDIVSNLKVFTERLVNTNGYELLKTIIDPKLDSIKAIIKTYANNIIKSRDEIEKEQISERQKQLVDISNKQSMLTDRAQFNNLLEMFKEDTKETTVKFMFGSNMKLLYDIVKKTPAHILDSETKAIIDTNITRIKVVLSKPNIASETFINNFNKFVKLVNEIYSKNNVIDNADDIVHVNDNAEKDNEYDNKKITTLQRELTKFATALNKVNSDSESAQRLNVLRNKLSDEYPIITPKFSEVVNTFLDKLLTSKDHPLLNIAIKVMLEELVYGHTVQNSPFLRQYYAHIRKQTRNEIANIENKKQTEKNEQHIRDYIEKDADNELQAIERDAAVNEENATRRNLEYVNDQELNDIYLEFLQNKPVPPEQSDNQLLNEATGVVSRFYDNAINRFRTGSIGKNSNVEELPDDYEGNGINDGDNKPILKILGILTRNGVTKDNAINMAEHIAEAIVNVNNNGAVANAQPAQQVINNYVGNADNAEYRADTAKLFSRINSYISIGQQIYGIGNLAYGYFTGKNNNKEDTINELNNLKNNYKIAQDKNDELQMELINLNKVIIDNADNSIFMHQQNVDRWNEIETRQKMLEANQSSYIRDGGVFVCAISIMYLYIQFRNKYAIEYNNVNTLTEKKRQKEIDGGNIFSDNSSMDSNKPSNKLTHFLQVYGDAPIVSMMLCRHTIPSAINYVAKKVLNYDDLYHLGIIIGIHVNGHVKKFLIEKQSYVMVSDTWSANDEFMEVSAPFNGVTLNMIFNKMVQVWGAHKVYSYNAISNNCQIFVMFILSTLNKIDDNVKNFVLQSRVQLYSNKYVEGFMRAVTRMDAFIKDRLMGGMIWKGYETVNDVRDMENYMINEFTSKRK